MMTALKADQETFKNFWNKKTTPQQAAALALGVHPETMARAERLISAHSELPHIFDKRNFSQGETDFWNAFHNLADHELQGCFWPNDLISLYSKVQTFWGKGKKDFVWNLYLKRINTQIISGDGFFEIEPHADFVSFLKKNKEWPADFEAYEDHKVFECDLNAWAEKNINDQETAIALLLALDPDYFKEWEAIEHKETRSLSEKEHFLAYQYRKFIFHRHGGDRLARDNRALCENMRQRGLWKGDFLQYIQALYDVGYLFNENLIEFLKKKGFDFKYSPSAWPQKVYEKYCNKNVLSLSMAVNLFAGVNPDGQGTVDRRLNYFGGLPFGARWITRKREWREIGAEDFEQKNEICLINDDAINVRREAIAAVKTKNLSSIEGIDGQDLYFDPKTIFTWLREITGFVPPPILEEIAFPKKGIVKTHFITASHAEHKRVFDEIQREMPGLPRDTPKGGGNSEEAEMRKRLSPKGFDQGHYRDTLRPTLSKRVGRPPKKSGR